MALVARAMTEAAGGLASLERLTVQFRGVGLPVQEIVVTETVASVADGVATVRAKATQGSNAIIRNAEAELRLP